MGVSSNAAGNSTLPEARDSMNPLHVVAVVVLEYQESDYSRIQLKALAQQRQIVWIGRDRSGAIQLSVGI